MKILVILLLFVLNDMIHSMLNTFFDGADFEEKYLIVVLTRLGLANRLRTLSDWYNIAIIQNRTMLVNWIPSLDCNVHFTDLFEVGSRFKLLPPPFTENGWESLLFQSLQTLQSERNISYLNIDEVFNLTFLLPQSILESFEAYQILFTTYDGVITTSSTPCIKYIVKHSEFLSSLVPLVFIRDVVKEVKEKYFSKSIMVGIHYRVHDAEQDWAVVPPVPGDQPFAKNFGEGASMEDFISAMDKIRSTNSNQCRFFVASNSDAHKQQFLAAFPDAVSISGDYSRSSADGMVFALIEWLLLSESALVVNTYGSTFAVEAAQRHMRPLVGIWNGHLIHHQSVYLPFCGHMLYAQAFTPSSSIRKFTYSEGTIDNRSVEGSAIAIEPCDHLKTWGLPSVLCSIVRSQ